MVVDIFCRWWRRRYAGCVDERQLERVPLEGAPDHAQRAGDARARGQRARGRHCQLVTFRAGDVMAFDGRWWHATSYSTPVLNILHAGRRHGGRRQGAQAPHGDAHAGPAAVQDQHGQVLQAVGRLDCGRRRLSIDWTSMDGHIALLPHQAKDAAAKPQPE